MLLLGNSSCSESSADTAHKTGIVLAVSSQANGLMQCCDTLSLYILHGCHIWHRMVDYVWSDVPKAGQACLPALSSGRTALHH